MRGALATAFLIGLCLLTLPLPSLAQKVIEKKPVSSAVRRHTMVEYQSVRMLALDRTKGEDEESTSALALFTPHHVRLRSGGGKRFVEFSAGAQMKEGPTTIKTVLLEMQEADLLMVRLRDLRRIGKGWRDNPGGEKVVYFNPHEFIQLYVSRSSASTVSWGLTVKGFTCYGFLEDATALITQLEKSMAWLKAR